MDIAFDVMEMVMQEEECKNKHVCPHCLKPLSHNSLSP
jgi:hypothetical protein